jgi:hypothetical protein
MDLEIPATAGHREKNGASEGIRTLDTHVGNVMLYQAELRSLPMNHAKLNQSSRIASLNFTSLRTGSAIPKMYVTEFGESSITNRSGKSVTPAAWARLGSNYAKFFQLAALWNRS